jgi:hypothetical protein
MTNKTAIQLIPLEIFIVFQLLRKFPGFMEPNPNKN